MKTTITLRIIAVSLILAVAVLFIVAFRGMDTVETITWEEAPVGELIRHGVNTSMQRTIDGRELQGE